LHETREVALHHIVDVRAFVGVPFERNSIVKKAVDVWLTGKPPTVRFIIAEFETNGRTQLRASSDDPGDDGPVGEGADYASALADLERRLRAQSS
jgi:hypothetical protein